MEDPTTSILLVEDNEETRHALASDLSHAGYKIIEASDGVTALDLALSQKPNLIVLDQFTPKLNASGITKELRKDEWGKSVPVIVAIETPSEVLVSEVVDAGANDYYTKSQLGSAEIIKQITGHLS